MENSSVLYRKYRPLGFNDVIGQEHITKTLINQIKGNKPSHAYLFCGTRGTGKTSVAKIFARAVNCTNFDGNIACGKCAFCTGGFNLNMDVFELDAASNNGVDEIRELKEKVKYAPVNAKYKVYIVDEVHMLSTSAFNAFLKTLEEPPAHAIFILATTEPHKLPATVLSRCIRFDF
ncbi:MAG: DNA polymerase III subunit gamma/tau, partial [Firmicutes bacterium]|nr:DNA polymerase III subunit gamma/tau [Bacillota bacterium]